MTIAIIGCGSIGARHARNAKALGVDVVPVDANHQRAASLCFELGARGWSEKLRAFDGVDAVMICTPASTHETVAKNLLVRGYTGPLFVEKPLALSSFSLVFRAWPHPITMVGYNLRFHPAVEHLRRARPTSGRFAMHCDSRQWPGVGYAGLIDECSHEIDLALHLGAPAHVLEAFMLSAHVAEIRLGNPYAGHHGDWTVHLNDRAGRYFRRWDAFGQAGGSSFIFSEPAALGDEMYVAELQHFLDAVRTAAPTRTPFSEGLRVAEICARVKGRAA